MRAKDFNRDKFFLEDWPNALESGQYKQGTGILYEENTGKYCCLGVACDLLSKMNLLPKKQWLGNTWLPERALKLLGIREDGGYKNDKERWRSLGEDNDDGVKFKTIAKRIKKLYKAGKFLLPD